MAISPFIQAIWFAEDIQQDKDGLIHVKGMFDHVTLDPASTRYEWAAYLIFAMRNIHEKVDLQLLYVDLSDNEILLERPFRVTSDDPLGTKLVALLVPSIPVRQPGPYSWEIHCENDMIGSTRIQASVLNQPGS